MNDEAQSADNETSQVSGGKGSGLTGGALTDEALDSSDGVLREAGTFGRKGLQQWYTPPDVARFIADVIGNLAAPALDLTAGDGALLEPWNYCYGIELDSDQIKSAEAKHRTYDAINGDVQRVFPLLHALKVEFPIIVINPPFGLDWRDEMLAPKGASSTLLTFKYAINRLARPGLGALICGRDRYDREIAALTADDPAGRKVFLRINVLDNLFDEPVALPCTIAFFSHETCEVPLTLDLPRSLLAVTGPGLRQHASVAPYVNKRVAYVSPWELNSTWDTVREEHKYGAEVRALGRPDHTVSIAGGKLKVYLRPVLKAAFDWQNINWIESLDGQSPNIFALNRRDWRRLCELRDQYANVGFDIEPSCEGKIQQAIADAARLTSPLYPIRPQQRLAYLDDVTRIKCIKTPKDAPTKRAVVEGKEYGVETRSRVMQRVVTKLNVSETTGETKQTRAERTFKILEIILTDLDTQRSFAFKESDEDINFLIEHFDVPHVGDVKETAPEEYERALRLVKSVEDEDFVPRGLALKNFQREDLARLLTKGGGCLAWEQGLGKCKSADSLVRINGQIMSAAAAFARFAVWTLLPVRQDPDGGEWFTVDAASVASLVDGKIETVDVSAFYRRWVVDLPMRRVTYSDGSVTETTLPHRLYNGTEWVNDITTGDALCVPSTLPHESSNVPLDVVRMIAWQIAEGHEPGRGGTVRITQKDESVLTTWVADARTFERRECVSMNNLRIVRRLGRAACLDCHSIGWRIWLEQRGYAWGERSAGKEIPPFIMGGTAEVAAEFLRHFFEAEGSVNKDNIELSSASRLVTEQLRDLLRRFGVWAVISTKRARATNSRTPIFRTYYRLTIGGEDARTFAEHVGFVGARKAAKLTTLAKRLVNDNKRGVPIETVIDRCAAATGLTRKTLGWRGRSFRGNYGREALTSQVCARLGAILDGSFVDSLQERAQQPLAGKTRKQLAAVLAAPKEPVRQALADINRLCNQAVHYAKVAKVEYFQYTGYIYDLSVPGPHNYVADGVLMHNTVAAMTFCEAVQNDDAEELALFIVPQDLVPQWQREAFRFCGRTLRIVGTVSDAITLAEDIKAGWRGWAITWFEALSRNGRANESVPHPAPVGLYARDLRFFEDQERKIKRNGRTKTVTVKVPCAPTPVDDSPPMLVSEWRESTKRHIPGGWGNYQDENGEWQYGYIPPKTETEVVPQTTKTHCPECRGTYAIGYSPATGRCKRPIHGEKHNDKVGKRRGSEKRVCGYTPTTLRLKPAYSFLLTAFRNGTIVIDEGTKIKGDTSLMSLSVRGLKAKYRILLTGTPIKNYITSAFWLLWWALGNNTVRFPYNYVGGSEKWAKDFAVIEQEFKQDKKGREHAGNKKVLPEISNVLVLWRLLSSSIIRRRMEDCGEEVQPIAYKPTEVPFGVKQLKMYRNWLDGDNFARYFLAKHPDCAIPPNRVAKMGALLGQNWKLEFATCLPEGELDQVDRYRAGATNWTPKNTLALELAMEHAAKGDKVLIGSPLMAHGPWLAHQLNLAGVYALHIVEESGELKTIGPRKRADVVKDFVDNGAQVLCAGVHALNLGHNLEVANVVILTGFPWDMSTLDQFVKRVRRITSKKPITVYPLMVKNTIDTRKWELLTNEIASSDLALDGFLRFKHEEPPSMQEVLNELMEKGIQATGDEIDEDSCKARWETFVKRFRTEHPELAPPEEPPLPWRTLLDADAEEVADGVLSLGDPPAVPLDFEHVEDVYYTGRGRTWTVYVDEEDGGTYLMDLELFLAGETETCEVSVLQ